MDNDHPLVTRRASASGLVNNVRPTCFRRVSVSFFRRARVPNVGEKQGVEGGKEFQTQHIVRDSPGGVETRCDGKTNLQTERRSIYKAKLATVTMSAGWQPT